MLGSEGSSLDPSDWNVFRDLCFSELGALIDRLAAVADGPAWQPVPASVKEDLAEALPLEPQGTRQVCDDIRESILPYTLGNTHPRFFGWVHGTGTAGGMLAEMFAGAINANLGGREHAPVHVERTVIEWCKEIFALPKSASGLLLSGTSMANLVALAVARNHHFPTNVREEGVASAPAPLVLYTSAEAHCSVDKAIELLGLGRRNIRSIPVNRELQMDVAALAAAVAADRAAGLQPFCVVGTAGTVNSAAIDDLEALADFCHRERLWFHVDGAFGALAILSDEYRNKLKGIERADSLAFDFHKWLHVPYDAGCVLVRDSEAHRKTFGTQANYLCDGRGAAAGAPWFCEFGPELSRGFRALKVWFTIKEHGLRRLGEKITENCRQARHLGELVDAHPRLERLAPVSLNIVCFRYVQPGFSLAELDRLNSELVIAIQESGIAVPSTTRIAGKLAIRVNITNHRTRLADLQILVNVIEELAPSVAARVSPSRPRRCSESALGAANVIEAVCAREDLQTLLVGVFATFDAGLAQPFAVDDSGAVKLGPDTIQDPATAAILLRHALEIVALRRLVMDSSPAAQASVAIFACRTAAIAASASIDSLDLPNWLAAAYEASLGEQDAPSTELLRRVLPLQGADPAVADQLTASDWPAIATRLRESESIAGPLEHLLTTGGDTRLEVDPQTRMSKYGCRAQPVADLASFGSCTATTISAQTFAATEQVRQRLVSAAVRGDFRREFIAEMEQVKRGVIELCGAAELPGTEVILCSSGTDAELHSVCLTAGASPHKLINIVIAPDETGTGVPEAAAGRHFSTRTPFGMSVKKGELVRGCRAEAIDVITVEPRDAAGSLRSIEAIDRDVEAKVESAVRHGQCLLHVLDVSKTGWGAPSLPAVKKLAERFGDRLTVVVDACQARLDRVALGDYLRAGYLVQITGSKTFGGPPFSGALLVPPRLAARFARIEQLPAGLREYAARSEWPADWKCAELFPDLCNAGLLLRWTAAIREMRSFYNIPDDVRTAILRELRDTIACAIEASPEVVELPSRVLDRGELSLPECWDRVQTIFPFRVRHREGWRRAAFLTHDEMKSLHSRLNADLSSLPGLHLTDSEAALAAFVCHLGQPVELARTLAGRTSALRFCTGANVVSRIAFDAALGRHPEDRLACERDRIRRVFAKIALILDRWTDLDRAEHERSRNELQTETLLTVC
ncbi:MAG TPA: pyridoxal-dependent decarboxylase [Gemmata sp.]|nr:pyridoxal-dependent decarboxylase [Gemmata sp.]